MLMKSVYRLSVRVSVAILLLTVPLVGALQICAAQSARQNAFTSADAASTALFQAVQSQDANALMQILGPNLELVTTNDVSQDLKDREQFVREYREMHRFVRQPNGKMILYLGAENWPFPIPLEAQDGIWRFDVEAGQEEVLYRQIGEGEMTAIATCRALTAAATKPQTDVDANSSVAILLAATRANGTPVQFKGYYFRVLPSAGTNAGAVLAYPVRHSFSGVMTFVVNVDGTVYEKDLGPKTAKIASSLAAFHVDSSWKPAETQQ